MYLILPYLILSRSRKAQAMINAAIAEYHKYTCIRFKKRKSGWFLGGGGERDYLYFYTGNGCSSPVGRYGGRAQISLHRDCWSKSTVIHEIGHSLGELSFWNVAILSMDVQGGDTHPSY